MTFNQVCSNIAKNEGKRKQTSIGNIREVMKTFIDLCVEEHAKTKNSKSLEAIVMLIAKRIDKK
jgi:hypothetical protein